jgi:hypothetical protein
VDWGNIPAGKLQHLGDFNTYVGLIAGASYVYGYAAAIHDFFPVIYNTNNVSVDYSEEFNKYKKEWEVDTSTLSDTNEISMHSAYQRIIGMGSNAVPLIIGEMSKKPGHWFWALEAITGEDPVPPEERGKINKMTDSWLEWWEENKQDYE